MSDKPLVFMAHISYGSCLRGSARQFDTAFLKPDDSIQALRYNTGFSLLAHAFNDAWATALNLQEDGKNIRYFFMMHDDIVPEDWWIRKMIDKLEKFDLDMLSCLVPLKDSTGGSSTAVDKFGPGHEWKPGDQYLWERRVTMKEAAKLPEVFTAADCGYPDRHLLANTGCWVCRFDRPWRHEVDENGDLKVFFKIDNRIHRHNGRWVPDCEPEDWFFSRRLQKLGCKVAVDRGTKLEHFGLIGYPNYAVYGQDYDKAFAENAGYKPIGEPRPDINFSYDSTELADVRGFLNDDEGRLLAEIATGKKVLEIGSYCGRSTIWMARTAKEVLAVDTWDGKGMTDPHDTLEIFDANIARHGLTDVVSRAGGTIKAVKKTNGWEDGSPWFNPEGVPFDVVFIDAGHSFEDVQSDIKESLPLLISGGLMAFHDYGRVEVDPGVTQAVDLLIQSGAEVVNRAGTVIVLKVQHGERKRAEPRPDSGTPGDDPGAEQADSLAGQADSGTQVVAGGSAEFLHNCGW